MAARFVYYSVSPAHMAPHEMRITEKRTAVILAAVTRPDDGIYRDRGIRFNSGDVEWCGHYGEPGYTDPEGDNAGILFGNWNDGETPLNAKSIAYLEEAGYALEWSDEWMIDYDGDKAYRTQADSYAWRPSAVIAPEACEYLTPDSDADEVIEAFTITDAAQKMVTVPHWVDEDEFKSAGFSPVVDAEGDAEDYQSGWYGREDDPAKIAARLIDDGARAVAFQITSSGQFAANFMVYRKD